VDRPRGLAHDDPRRLSTTPGAAGYRPDVPADGSFAALPLEEAATAALERALALGSSAAEIRIERIRSQVVVLRDGRVQTTADDTEIGMGLRVVRDRSMGFAATVELHPQAAAELADKAVAMAEASAPALAVPVDSPLLLAGWDAPTGDSRAAVAFVVPDSGARIWVQGMPTSQTGTLRRFITPPLNEKSLYEYDVRAQWINARGQWQDESQTVQVRAGAVVNVVFANKTP